MKEEYSKELLTTIDSVVERLRQEELLANEDIHKDEYDAYRVLRKEGWVIISEMQFGDISYVNKSDDFKAKLAGGTFSEQYFREKEQLSSFKNINITANNSNVAVGSCIQQNFNMSNFDNAINEIERSEELTDVQKQEIIELFNDLKNAEKDHYTIAGTLFKQLARWSDSISKIGSAIASIYLKYQSQTQPFIDQINT